MLDIYLNKISHFLNYDIYFPFSFIFLLFLTIVYFSKINEERKIRILKLILAIICFIYLTWSLFLTFLQYKIWQNDALSRYLLPPYQKINYFLSYAYFHFWRDLVYRFLGVILTISFFLLLNFVFKRDIFYKEEKIFVSSILLFYFFPYNLLLIFLAFFVLLLLIMVAILKQKKLIHQRFSLKNYWPLLAWLFLLLSPFILTDYKFLKYKP